MHLLTQIRLLLIFYRNFALVSIGISVLGIRFLGNIGVYFFSVLFWIKIVTTAIIFYLIDQYRRKEYPFYRNFGLSKKILWMGSLTLDFILLILLYSLYQALL